MAELTRVAVVIGAILPTSLILTEKLSINTLLSRIKDEQVSGLDVLIQVAGVYHYRNNISAKDRNETLDLNYHATLSMCQNPIPLIRPGGRIVNLSSQSGQLHYFTPQLRERFLK
ncbi:hypothetical protein HYFRA_00011010 [Hymenoscyphus fraxineus]|uniref:Uncharacterized protein n=1 Tax=Hymenoscyphus fraxineus TaxID=746836 RepID=A0A9N9PJF4_9HELO|nr:hypothetical protein HYFRA_00011010 [Hymenoscyphus fraxineus]